MDTSWIQNIFKLGYQAGLLGIAIEGCVDRDGTRDPVTGQAIPCEYYKLCWRSGYDAGREALRRDRTYPSIVSVSAAPEYRGKPVAEGKVQKKAKRATSRSHLP
jgi:hypothetical protein